MASRYQREQHILEALQVQLEDKWRQGRAEEMGGGWGGGKVGHNARPVCDQILHNTSCKVVQDISLQCLKTMVVSLPKHC